MKCSFLIGLVLLTAMACKKPRPESPVDPQPEMIYKNLSDSSVLFGRWASFDLDGNGEKDVLFNTQLVGDPIEKQDKKQWLVTSSFNTNLPVNNAEQIPVLNYKDSVSVNDYPAYTWYNASSILLAQKTMTMTTLPFWIGGWKAASHHFIPIQLKKQEAVFCGWIEVSFSINEEKLILHRAAVSKQPNKAVAAGK